MAFPSLSVEPTYPYSIKTVEADQGITTKAEFGYVHGRSRFTKKRKQFHLSYKDMIDADQVLLEAHFENVGIHTSFTWTDKDSNSFTVRYLGIPELTLEYYNHWSCEIDLLEV